MPRQFPNDNLYIERGGDPDIASQQRAADMEKKVRSTYGEFVS